MKFTHVTSGASKDPPGRIPGAAALWMPAVLALVLAACETTAPSQETPPLPAPPPARTDPARPGSARPGPAATPAPSAPAPAPSASRPAAPPPATPAPSATPGVAQPPVVGVASPEDLARFKAEQKMAEGLALYEKGDFNGAIRRFGAREIEEGPNPIKIDAHKYMAFSHCVSNRRVACKQQFAAALKLNPAFELTPAEAAHPTWGPIFRQARQEAGRPASR